jgi:micrococcal nuclease
MERRPVFSARVKAVKSCTISTSGRTGRTDCSAGIDAKVLRANPEWTKTLQGLQGRQVRGWIECRSGPYIAIEDPSLLTVVDEGAHPQAVSPGGPVLRARQRRVQ